MSDLREALKNASGFLDTPVARRKFGNDPFYSDVVASIRAALSAQPQPEAGKNLEDAVTSTIFLSLADKDVVKATDCRLVAKRLLSEVIVAPPLAPDERMRRALERIRDFPHSCQPCEQAMARIAHEALSRADDASNASAEAREKIIDERAAAIHTREHSTPPNDSDKSKWAMYRIKQELNWLAAALSAGGDEAKKSEGDCGAKRCRDLGCFGYCTPSDPTPAEQREAVARVIYDAFPFNEAKEGFTKPGWTDGGNSVRQDDARRAADRILALSTRAGG